MTAQRAILAIATMTTTTMTTTSCEGRLRSTLP
jgi:hypothetical protein